LISIQEKIAEIMNEKDSIDYSGKEKSDKFVHNKKEEG
jgi:hypothetical protein